jgi:hypothetical protein
MPDQNQQNQPQGGQGQKQHKVTKQFTDNNGRTWKVGETFTGNAQAIQAAKSAGQIQESSGSGQSSQSGQAE